MHLYIYATTLHGWLTARKLPKSSARSMHAKNSNAVIRDRSLHDCDLKAEPNYESMDYVIYNNMVSLVPEHVPSIVSMTTGTHPVSDLQETKEEVSLSTNQFQEENDCDADIAYLKTLQKEIQYTSSNC